MSTTTKKKRKKPEELPKAVGMWKNRWPKSKSSVEIARNMRKEQWKRN